MHYLNREIVKKVIRRYVDGYGIGKRSINLRFALILGRAEVSKQQPFETASDAAETFACILWNSGAIS